MISGRDGIEHNRSERIGSNRRWVRAWCAAASGLFLALASTLVGIAPASAAPGLQVSDLAGGTTAIAMATSLVGGNIGSITNATFVGNTRAGGLFTSGDPTLLGFTSGVVLSSGKAQTKVADVACSKGVEGPNGCNEHVADPATQNSTAFGNPGDPVLTTLAGDPTFDAAILSFDFVPQFPNLQFKYVFSSDEFSDYANTAYNDVFGFFVNGTNCALVPGTTEPVAVNTINNGNDAGGDPTPHHASLFRDNVRPAPSIDTEMDGLTTVLTCNATVTPGQSNHLRLAIADASDEIFDSAVFIAGSSLVSGTAVETELHGGGQSAEQVSVVPGTAVFDSAELSGTKAATATGTVTYTVFSDDKCQNIVANAGTKPVSGGHAGDSNPQTFTAPGLYYWQAHYSGDANNNPSTSLCGIEVETVTGNDPPISATAGSVTATEGNPFTEAVATFIDPETTAGADEFTASIDWGDGTAATAATITGSAGSFVVTGGHTYIDEGAYTFTVTIVDIDSAASGAVVSGTATVIDAPLAATGLTTTSTKAFAGPVATFVDANPFETASALSATIDWGDGSLPSSGTVSGPDSGHFTVNGTHTYQQLGPFTIAVHIVDEGGSFADAVTGVVVFDYASGGAFVIGDKANTVGSQVTFWSSQWAKTNPLAKGSAPAAFKGFEGVVTRPAVGTPWRTGPGASAGPPPRVPTYMAVIVTTKVAMTGSAITGDTAHIVIVKTAPGYGADPGKTGRGTIVAVVS